MEKQIINFFQMEYNNVMGKKKFGKKQAFINKKYSDKKKWNVTNFELGKVIGKGKYGTVFLAREKSTHFMMALKVISKYEAERNQLEEQVSQEIEIQMFLKHRYILSMYTYFWTDENIYMALEYAPNGDLYSFMRDQDCGRVPEDLVARYMFQLAEALEFCHSQGVIHRDVKPENVLLDLNYDVKLSDFGWSARIEKGEEGRRLTFCGTFEYLSPEIVEGNEYTKEVDNWCLGVLCYELIVGLPPFHCLTKEESLRRITKVIFKFTSFIQHGAREFILSLLKYNPKERLSLRKVMNHPWILATMKRGHISIEEKCY